MKERRRGEEDGRGGKDIMAGEREFTPRLIAWEVTRSCMLACKHCRAAAANKPYEGELSTEECYRLLDNITSFAKPIIILTGGEPMLREDIYDIARYADSLGLPVVLATCGMTLDDRSAAELLASGVKQISISLDGATAQSHDTFRGVDGAFDGAMRGIEAAKRAGLPFQINTTVTAHNAGELARILQLAVDLGASAFNPFLLVPTGRGRELADQELSPQRYESTLHWLADQQPREDITIRVTCAPHYQRILRQRHVPIGPRQTGGCMGGKSFAFISHTGKVQICGFLEAECGDVRAEDMDFCKIWRTSPIFAQLRDPSALGGRCGVCEFGRVCGGCRARAFAITGDYLAEEPFCTYQPKAAGKDSSGGGLTELDKRILDIIQTNFPVVQRPFDVLAKRLATEAGEIVARVSGLRDSGIIRRIGAVFDSRRLGYVSTLVAARIPTDRLDEVAALVSALPGVTHNYARDHAYNLWFTLTVRSAELIEAQLAKLRSSTGIAEFFSLPSLKVYKIRVDFALAGRSRPQQAAPTGDSGPIEIDDNQKKLIRMLQDDLPAGDEPLNAVACALGRPLAEVIGQIDRWLADGVIRRFGAVVRHRRLGFGANGMAVFNIPDDRIDEAGLAIAQRAEVSHCYHRPRLDDLPCNLFAMIHGQSEEDEEIRRIAADAAAELQAKAHKVLLSVKEYKKTSMQYFVD